MPDPNQYLESLDANQDEIKPKKRRKWRRIAALLLVAGLIAGASYVGYVSTIVSGASTRAFALSPLTTDGKGNTNVLVLGVGDAGHAGEKLTDTMLVMSINAKKRTAVYISIPRDLRVRPEGYNAVKINQANALGGSELARKTVEDVLGIEIQYTLTTNFNGLKDLVDAVGGIDVVVEKTLSDPEYPCSDDENRSCGFLLKAGPQHLDGALALQYARCRKGNCGNDFGRAARQQEVIDKVRAKVENPRILLHPAEIAGIAGAIRNNMTTDLSGLNLSEFLRGLNLAKDQTTRFVLSTEKDGLLTSGNGSSDLVPVGGDYDQIQAKVDSLIGR